MAGVTVKDIKGEEKEDKNVYIFRAGKGAHGHGFRGGRGGGRRKASPSVTLPWTTDHRCSSPAYPFSLLAL